MLVKTEDAEGSGSVTEGNGNNIPYLNIVGGLSGETVNSYIAAVARFVGDRPALYYTRNL